jgi:hypothetical protein
MRQGLEGMMEVGPGQLVIELVDSDHCRARLGAHLVARQTAFFIHCCPSVAAGLYAFFVRKRAMYASIRGTRSGVNPPYVDSHRAISLGGIVDVSCPAIGKGDVTEALRVSACRVKHSHGSTTRLHRPGSLKRLINDTHSVALVCRLFGESFFSHIQTSVLDVLSVPSDSP